MLVRSGQSVSYVEKGWREGTHKLTMFNTLLLWCPLKYEINDDRFWSSLGLDAQLKTFSNQHNSSETITLKNPFVVVLRFNMGNFSQSSLTNNYKKTMGLLRVIVQFNDSWSRPKDRQENRQMKKTYCKIILWVQSNKKQTVS